MFDQSFSAENYLSIFHEENRKGHIAFDDMPELYKDIVMKMKVMKSRVNEITKKKKSNRTEDEISELERLKLSIKDKQTDRDKELFNELNKYAQNANIKDFTFPISNYIDDDKQIFTIDTSQWTYFYAIKNLQRILRGLFNVKQANKHQIMSNVKLLLNTTTPFYLIRTDITGFFESIPQQALLDKINANNLVNNKTKGMIKGILSEYNRQKDPTKIKADCGVPRGIGISSYLSEIYMHDIDQHIRNLGNVIFYARYVDDILIILAGFPNNQSISEYYKRLKNLFQNYGLEIKNNNPAEDKCKLIDFYNSTAKQQFTYLGYKITISKPKSEINAEFGMSDKKIAKIKQKIDASFAHFEQISAIDLKRAKRDLLDSLDLISGNFRLTKSKERVKAGLFFGNDLLTDYNDLDVLTSYLSSKSITPHGEVLKGRPDRTKYKNSIKKKVDAINFQQRWHNRIMFKFNPQRIAEISEWLS